MKTKKRKKWLKLEIEYYENCLEATQIEKKINYLEKNELDVDSLRKNQKAFIKNNKLILKLQQRRRSEKRSAFTKKVNKNSIEFKWIQLIDSIEICSYRTSKKIVHKNEKH